MIDPSLLLAYRNTTYRAFFAGEWVDIRVGGGHVRLDELLDGKDWAFVSACNPGSLLSTENVARHRALLLRLDGYLHYPALGIPDAGEWPAEESVLVAGIPCAQALRIAREFGQNAILCGGRGRKARLVLVS